MLDLIDELRQDEFGQEIDEGTQSAEERVQDPLCLVIFGATGDLAHRKLIPALYSLAQRRLLPDRMAIVGFGRTDIGEEGFRRTLRDAISEWGWSERESDWEGFACQISYVQGHYDDEGSFRRLREALDDVDRRFGTGTHRLFYLATPPTLYADIVRGLGRAGLNRCPSRHDEARLVVEKPFGRDLESARWLDTCIHEVFDESQVYRIDHYLGKETVQNIFVLRFVNGIFEPIWNRNYVDHVQITVAEDIGIENRGGYYEQAGATRDMLQSHLLQLLALTAMEPPAAFTADKVRDEKVKVLSSLGFLENGDPAASVVRGQYVEGRTRGRTLPGYRDEYGVSPDSTTETYVAAALTVDNWRWAGVPFYLRTGKRMSRRVSEIAVQFRRAPHMLLSGGQVHQGRHNVLALRIQPNEGLALGLDVKVPGPGMRTRPVDMSFLYRDAFDEPPPDAYQRLLLDAMRGDCTLFARTDEVETAWRLVDPLLQAWATDGRDVPAYPTGGQGPVEADALLGRSGRRWRAI